jgi:hypothetical protein
MDRVLLSLALSRVCPEPVLVKHWTNKITLVFLLLAPAADRLQRITCENAIFEQFIYTNDHFSKTGSGQT